MTIDGSFRALGNAKRRALLQLMRNDAQPVGELADALEMTQPAVSQHLAVLREAGLVTVERVGRHRLYRADHNALQEVRQFFEAYWTEAVDRLAVAAEHLADERLSAS